MKHQTVPYLTASITLGKDIQYSDEHYSIEELYATLQVYQNKRIIESKIYLSAFVYQGDIVMSGQIEPHFKIKFINYPKFPLSASVFKEEIILLTKHLMKVFNQNRVVIIFNDELLMLEETNEIDPRIITENNSL